MTEDLAARARLTRSAALASIAMALVLGAMKAWAVVQTASTAMLGSLEGVFASCIGLSSRFELASQRSLGRVSCARKQR